MFEKKKLGKPFWVWVMDWNFIDFQWNLREILRSQALLIWKKKIKIDFARKM